MTHRLLDIAVHDFPSDNTALKKPDMKQNSSHLALCRCFARVLWSLALFLLLHLHPEVSGELFTGFLCDSVSAQRPGCRPPGF